MLVEVLLVLDDVLDVLDDVLVEPLDGSELLVALLELEELLDPGCAAGWLPAGFGT